MSDIHISATPEGEEFETRCDCCGRPIYWGHGWLDSSNASLAAYWYQWSEGHQGRFVLAIARFDSDENLIPGVASVSGHIETDAIHYSILEPSETSWMNLSRFGPLLSREAALPDKAHLFELVDAISANDQRLSARILASGIQA
jgi:hypothetical protein